MRLLVVGASGFIGSRLLRYFRASGYTVLGTQSRPIHTGLIPFNLLEHRIADCVEEEFFQTDEPIVGVICAAICQIDRCQREQQLSHKVNVEQTIRLIEDLSYLNVKPVFLSSDAVFDGSVGYYGAEDGCNCR